jgi:hypothetical protein
LVQVADDPWLTKTHENVVERVNIVTGCPRPRSLFAVGC